ncbi:MAG: helix-turn-helix domain-containing protein [Microvirga sp.]
MDQTRLITDRSCRTGKAPLASRFDAQLVKMADVIPMHLREYGKNAVVCSEGQIATHYYRVVAGAVRACTHMRDGRRQIAAFYLPGDVFGIERGAVHRLSAEVTRRGIVATYPRCSLNEPTYIARPQVYEMLESALIAMELAQRHIVLLSHRDAYERIASFLIDLSDRLRRDVIELPMPRIDIADHLGLTIETVSRMFAQLERAGLIDLPAPRTAVLRDKAELRRLQDGRHSQRLGV